MNCLKKSITKWITNKQPILIVITIYTLSFLIAWAYDQYGPKVGRIPILLFVSGSLIGTLAESSARNLTKGNSIKATFKMTLRKTTSDDNGIELLLIVVKWLAFSIAGIALVTMAANLTSAK